ATNTRPVFFAVGWIKLLLMKLFSESTPPGKLAEYSTGHISMSPSSLSVCPQTSTVDRVKIVNKQITPLILMYFSLNPQLGEKSLRHDAQRLSICSCGTRRA